MFAAEREQLLYMYGTRRWCFTKSCTNSTSNLSTVCVVSVHIFELYYIVFFFPARPIPSTRLEHTNYIRAVHKHEPLNHQQQKHQYYNIATIVLIIIIIIIIIGVRSLSGERRDLRPCGSSGVLTGTSHAFI